VGNLYADGDLESIWHGPTMTELRQAILENRLYPVCIGSSCVYIKGAVSEEQDDNHVAQKDRLKAMADSGSGWAAAVYGSSKLFDGDFTEAEQYFALGVVLLGTVLVEHDASPAGCRKPESVLLLRQTEAVGRFVSASVKCTKAEVWGFLIWPRLCEITDLRRHATIQQLQRAWHELGPKFGP
jgi:hypothetical protein